MKAKLTLNGKEYKVEVSEELVKEIEKPKYKSWCAEKGERYYFLSDLGEILSVIDFRDRMDDFRYSIGNYSETKEELEEKKKKLLYRQQYIDFIGEYLTVEEDFKNKRVYKYYTYYDFDNKILKFGYGLNAKIESIYSKFKEKIKDFIKEIGEDNFKKYILEVNTNEGGEQTNGN